MNTDTLLATATEAPPAAECFHCGQPADYDEACREDDRLFCCLSCRLVYQLLRDHRLDGYYAINDRPGTTRTTETAVDYAFLDDADLRDQLLDYYDEASHRLRLHLPQIHCSACVWLLERLHDLQPGITSTRGDFTRRLLTLTYDPRLTNLRTTCELLAKIGYAPELTLDRQDRRHGEGPDRSLFYQLGVAGFAFGNIMLLSFPEYLGLRDPAFTHRLSYLNLLLSLPVLLYSAQSYWRSAYWGLRQGTLNLDVPITLGMLAIFARSTYVILNHAGPGYLDSLAGLVFFLLVGKWFQRKTYRHLSFERDYRAYFPLAVRVRTGAATVSRPLSKIRPGDVLVLKDGELIPTDGTLLTAAARIDYSFVTGEAEPVSRGAGDRLFAGGRQRGTAIEVRVSKRVDQSYLTQLWRDDAFRRPTTTTPRSSDAVGRRFTLGVLTIAGLSLAYWWPLSVTKAVDAFSAVLIIACPCAIALTIPFVYGNVLRRLGVNKFYLKHVGVIEALQSVTTIVFDKTGTLSTGSGTEVVYEGDLLTDSERAAVAALADASTHPLSRRIAAETAVSNPPPVREFHERAGRGVTGKTDKHRVRLGSAEFADAPDRSAGVHLKIDGVYRGRYRFRHALRPGIQSLIRELTRTHRTLLLSGDHARGNDRFAALFPKRNAVHFRQSPRDKLDFIRRLQDSGERVMMIGDGLNDAGALRQADVGIVVTDDTNNFTPAADAILAGERLPRLGTYLRYVQRARRILHASYALALGYNLIGLSYAVSAELSPVIAAILMPLSSITIIVFGVGLSSWLGHDKSHPPSLR